MRHYKKVRSFHHFSRDETGAYFYACFSCKSSSRLSTASASACSTRCRYRLVVVKSACHSLFYKVVCSLELDLIIMYLAKDFNRNVAQSCKRYFVHFVSCERLKKVL